MASLAEMTLCPEFFSRVSIIPSKTSSVTSKFFSRFSFSSRNSASSSSRL